MVCLDYWLDNVMSNASDVALCLHTDGVVQGYRVVPTSELPYGGNGLGDGFSPAAVTECAVSVLRFLRQHCTREAGTYWLVRPHGGDELRLFDITDGPPTTATGGEGSGGAAADGEGKSGDDCCRVGGGRGDEARGGNHHRRQQRWLCLRS